jgi:glc operon protein GlcG
MTIRIGTCLAALLAVTTLGSAGAAEMATHKATLTLDGAMRVAASAVSEAKRLSAPGGAIAVVDDGGNLLYLERLDNTFPAAATVAIEKARTASTFRRPTRVFEEAIKGGRVSLVAVDVMTPLQGGVPILIDGQVVGAIGVSGAASAQQDDDLAAAAVAAWDQLGVSMSAAPASASAAALASASSMRPAEVTYYRAENVEKSFAQGAVLFDHGTNYMIHTSRRVAPGKAEVHTKDTDLIYVLDGSATFVTGGHVVDGSTTAPDEIRGASIDGGETRVLSKGDVIVVPAGTPHWFRDVRGPVLYYTIKVR